MAPTLGCSSPSSLPPVMARSGSLKANKTRSTATEITTLAENDLLGFMIPPSRCCRSMCHAACGPAAADIRRFSGWCNTPPRAHPVRRPQRGRLQGGRCCVTLPPSSFSTPHYAVMPLVRAIKAVSEIDLLFAEERELEAGLDEQGREVRVVLGPFAARPRGGRRGCSPARPRRAL